MKRYNFRPAAVRHTRALDWSISAVLLLAVISPATGIAQSLQTVELPQRERRIRLVQEAPDGSIYEVSSVYPTSDYPISANAPQSEHGGGFGGDCTLPTGFIGSVPTDCQDVHIMRTDAQGNLQFATLLGGNKDDLPSVFALDSRGNVIVAGRTGGSFPTTPGALSETLPDSETSGFLAKLSADGSEFLFATYLPAPYLNILAIALGRDDAIYLSGRTRESQPFVIKLSSDGAAIPYIQNFPGPGGVSALALDASGSLYIAGTTFSTEFPMAGEAPVGVQDGQNAFVAQLDAAGVPVAARYLGGGNLDGAGSLDLGPDGVFVAGVTYSLNFPTTPDAWQATAPVPMGNLYPGGFVTKLSLDLATIRFSSYVPTTDGVPTSICLYCTFRPSMGVTQMAAAQDGGVWIGGAANAGFPVTHSAPQACPGQGVDAFVAKLGGSGDLQHSSFLGRGQQAYPTQLRVDGAGTLSGILRDAAESRVEFSIEFGDATSVPTPCLAAPVSSTSLDAVSPWPGQLITLIGSGIGPEQGVSYVLGEEIPTTLGGVEVRINGVPAPLFYVSSRQVNLQVPYEPNPGAVTPDDYQIELTYHDQTLRTAARTFTSPAPGIFRLAPGASAQLAATHADGTLNGPDHPAPAGSVISLWGTNFGEVSPSCATGAYNFFGPAPLAPPGNVSVTVSGFYESGPSIPRPQSEYAGGAPTLPCGVQQINIRIPEEAEPGTVVLRMTRIEITTQPDGSDRRDQTSSGSLGVIYVE